MAQKLMIRTKLIENVCFVGLRFISESTKNFLKMFYWQVLIHQIRLQAK